MKTLGDYINDLKKGKGCAEVDTIVMGLYLGIELQIYTLDESGLIKQSFNFLNSKTQSKPQQTIRMYLEPNCKFDTIYNKSTIKSAGICQSILLDVQVFM